MIDPANVPEVDDTEFHSRFILQSNHFRTTDATITHRAFQPYKQEVSVHRHRESTIDEVWMAGRDVAEVRELTLYGRADVYTYSCLELGLKIVKDPIENDPVASDNPNHALILGFPADKEEQKSIGQELAAIVNSSFGGFVPAP